MRQEVGRVSTALQTPIDIYTHVSQHELKRYIPQQMPHSS